MRRSVEFLRTEFDQWFASLPLPPGGEGLPARGSVAACLVVLERLKSKCELDLDCHRAKGGAQIQGLTPSAVRKILASHGEYRPFLKEGGRTNRGGPAAVDGMLRRLRTLGLDREEEAARIEVLATLQHFLVEKVREYHDRRRISFVYNASQSTSSVIGVILGEAQRSGKAGPVAQHLVGAKLEIRFPRLPVSNHGASAADASTGRIGDFELGDTVFHVTVAPTHSVFEKCKSNLAAGSRVFLLVPESKVAGARLLVEPFLGSPVAVESIESFIANNLEEIGEFTRDGVKKSLRRLIETYNRRVNGAESDKSLLIELPVNLA